MLWVLKRIVSMRRCFEHPKHMLKIMGKKIFTILRQDSPLYIWGGGGGGVTGYNFQKNNIFLSLKIDFVSANSADTDGTTFLKAYNCLI